MDGSSRKIPQKQRYTAIRIYPVDRGTVLSGQLQRREAVRSEKEIHATDGARRISAAGTVGRILVGGFRRKPSVL